MDFDRDQVQGSSIACIDRELKWSLLSLLVSCLSHHGKGISIIQMHECLRMHQFVSLDNQWNGWNGFNRNGPQHSGICSLHVDGYWLVTEQQ